jgi:hypothetical protein
MVQEKIGATQVVELWACGGVQVERIFAPQA